MDRNLNRQLIDWFDNEKFCTIKFKNGGKIWIWLWNLRIESQVYGPKKTRSFLRRDQISHVFSQNGQTWMTFQDLAGKVEFEDLLTTQISDQSRSAVVITEHPSPLSRLLSQNGGVSFVLPFALACLLATMFRVEWEKREETTRCSVLFCFSGIPTLIIHV